MRKVHQLLTERRIRALKADSQRTEVMDGALPGLGIRVYPAGSKSWFLRYSPREARKRIVLGPYPALSLDAARNKARELVAGVKISGSLS